MSWLLDTCALSEQLHKRPDPRFVEWIEGQDADELHISAIAVGEIRKGISLLPKSARKAQLEQWLSKELLPFFEGRILEFGRAEALEWGARFAQCQINGCKPAVIDSMLAATAIVHGLTLVTRNERDFLPLGAEVFNPWQVDPRQLTQGGA